MKRRIKKFIAALCALIVTGLATFYLVLWMTYSQEDKGLLESIISQALSSPDMKVSVGAVDGALSSDATIRDVVISDKDGVWLTLDRARLVWTRTALLSRRLEINRLEIGKLTLARKPASSEPAQPTSDAPLLPELPLRIDIQRFALGEFVLGQPVAGQAARLSAEGRAKLGPPAEGLDLVFTTKRLDRPGAIDIKVGLVPTTQALTVKMTAQEPQGGLIAHLAALPGLPPVDLNIDGDGTLDAFNARLRFVAGSDLGADGDATLRRQGGVRRLSLAAAARIEGLLPPPAAPIFAGATRLDGDLVFADSGAMTAERLAVVARVARLDVVGGMTADKRLNATATISAIPDREGVARTGSVAVKALESRFDVGGSVSEPRIAGRFNLADAILPTGRFGRLTATFSATPDGPVTEPATRIALQAEAEGTQLSFADPVLAETVGDSAKFSLRGRTARDGQGEYEFVRLGAPSLDLGYSGALGPKRIAGRLDVKLPDLSRFAALAGLPLKGEGAVIATLDGAPDEERVTAALDGHFSGLGTGIGALDGLTDGRITLSGGVKRLSGGGFEFEDLRVAGAHATALVKGGMSPAATAVDLQVSVPDLQRADLRLSGRGSMMARLTGDAQRLNADTEVSIAEAGALGRPIPRLTLQATARDLMGALDARLSLDGEIDRKPAKGGVKIVRQAAGGWLVDQLDIGVGSVRIGGAAALSESGLANGRFTLAAADLDDLSPLVLQKMAGALNGSVVLDVKDGRQGVKLDLKGSGLRADTVMIDRLDAGANLVDAFGKPIVDANVSVDRAVVAGEEFSKVRLLAKGTPAGSDISLAADARGFNLSGTGRIVPAEPLRFDLAAFEARRGSKRIALAGPASIEQAEGGVTIRNLAIAADGGRISVEGRAGSTLALGLAIKSLPLSVVEVVKPGLGLAGMLDGQANISGSIAAPAGDWRLNVSRLVAPQTRSAGLPGIDATASGTLGGRRTTLSGSVAAGKMGSLRLTGSLPLDTAGELDLAAKGELDAGIVNASLAGGGQRLTGRVALDATVRGTAKAPLASGSATMNGGSFEDPLQGVRLEGIQLRVAAKGENVVVERASATTRNGGTLSASGHVRIAPDAGFPGSIRIRGNRAQLASNETVQAVANLSLELSGALAQRPRINGRVDVVSLDVAVPERIAGASQPLPGTKFVGASKTAAARIAAEKKAKSRGRRAPAFNADIDLTLSAPNRIFVRGRGIDAELGGDLRLTGTMARPTAVGAFELRRGRLNVLAQRLDFKRGRLTFSGDLAPELDFLAETQAGDVTAQVAVTGPATQPTFAFTSQPNLPQDEVLSRVMFQKASGSLSPTQALQLAAAAAQFAGGGGGDTFEKVRKSLGVDSLDVGAGPGGPTVGASRYISDNVSVGVRTGATPAQSAISVDINVMKRLRVQGEMGVDGRSAVGVGTEIEY